MEILFTGANCFTGMWFVKELVAAGHKVTAVFKRPLEEYSSVRLERVRMIQSLCPFFFDVKFGDDKFLEIIRSQPRWDMLCHHAADVTDYKSAQFDFVKAVANNTHNISSVMKNLQEKHCSKILLTGSVFEQREGRGTNPLRAFSPYGLSKGLTYDIFSYYASVHGMLLGKFVIPNPFGPYEEARFTSYLIETWIEGKTAQVKTPQYIRDNVPVTLLAKAYNQFASELKISDEMLSFHPSCYAISQGEFATLVANAMKSRLNLPCELEICEQTSFTEPQERVNFNPLDWKTLQWDQEAAWDGLAEYYLQKCATV